MKFETVRAHLGLFYVLFGMFEMLLLGGSIWARFENPHIRSPFEDAVGIVGLFSLLGLMAVSWLLRRVSPRVAVSGWFTVLGALLANMTLP